MKVSVVDPADTASESFRAQADQALPDAMVHVDLDGAEHIFSTQGWAYSLDKDHLFSTGMHNLLEFLEARELRATLFTIASDLENPEKRGWLEEAVRRGHEIASHSVTHPHLDRLSLAEKEDEIFRSKRVLEDELQTKVEGFRAPSYSIDRDVLELLSRAGYRYDSSVFPTESFAKKLQVPFVPAGPHRPLFSRPLMELPLPRHDPSPFPFHPCYSLILGGGYFRWGLRRQLKTKQPLVLLFHLTDFAEPLDGKYLPNFKSRIFTLSHLSVARKQTRIEKMMDLVDSSYRVTSTSEFLGREEQKLTANGPRILAISTTHETGAALLEGDQVRAAVSEERLDRVKFSTAYPPKLSIESCLQVSGIDPRDISDVVVSGLHPSKLIPRSIRNQFRDFFEFHGLNDYIPHGCKVLYRSFYLYRALRYGSIRKYLRTEFGIQPKLHFVEHHLCHASSVYRSAPFRDGLIVTADGVGDELSLTVSSGRDGRIERLCEIPYPHSFGQFYTACTQILGFRGGRHEGKITGLSGYGKLDPELLAKVRGTIRKSGPEFALDKRFYSEGIIRGFSPRLLRSGESLFDALQYRNYKKPLKKLLEGYPREDVAAVFQKLLEEEMEKIVRPFIESTGHVNLALAGGIFANVKLNSCLFRGLELEKVYIFPNMGDGGLSVGAGLELLQADPKPFDSVYWGPAYGDDEMESSLREAASQGLCFERCEDIEQRVAELLAEKKVIARFNGAMEFGPRALCNRSILYSASDPGANTWLNNQLGRTEFMPFAPVALAEAAPKLFVDYDGFEHSLKFMTAILPCTKFTKEKCPAVVHVDGTARPQLVTENINESMYRILKNYEAITGIPLLVNTSFNMHEEPIVCSPDDAVRAYLASKLDYLAIGDYLAWIDPDLAHAEAK